MIAKVEERRAREEAERKAKRKAEEKRARALHVCTRFASPGGGVPARVSRSLLLHVSGYLSHCAEVVFGGRLCLRAFYTASAMVGRRRFLVLPPHLRLELGMETAWWTRLLGSSHELVERSLFQRGNPDHAMFSTDASTYGCRVNKRRNYR